MPDCMFCGASKVTKEHLWGKWWKKFYPPRGDRHSRLKQTFTKVNSDLSTEMVAGTFRNSGEPLSSTTRVVCENCNNTWMSDIEDGMKKAYTAVYELGEEKIDRKRGIQFAKWIYLKHCLLLRSVPAENRYLAMIPGDPIDGREAVRALQNEACASDEKDWREFRRSRRIPKGYSIFIFQCRSTRNDNVGATNPIHLLKIRRGQASLKRVHSNLLMVGKFAAIISNANPLRSRSISQFDRDIGSGQTPDYVAKVYPLKGVQTLSSRHCVEDVWLDGAVRSSIPGVPPMSFRPYWMVKS